MSMKINAEALLRQGFAGQAQRRRAEEAGGNFPLRLRGSALNPLTTHHARAAFTLVELLTVIVIIAILASVTAIGLHRARELARRTRAETELREMVAAWLQYHQLYGEYPSLVKDQNDLDTSRKILAPLIDPESADNPRGLVLLNPKLPFNGKDEYVDPWGTPYQLSFAQAEVEATTAMRTSIAFPCRQRRFP